MIVSVKPIALIVLLVLSGFSPCQAAAPASEQVTAAISLQGGSDSNAKWVAPSAGFSKVYVFTPKNGTTTNALYRVYPKGQLAGSTDCHATDAKFPCYEVTIDQTQHQNAWTQLTLDGDPATQWEFTKDKGFVIAVASNLGAMELLNLSVSARFENQTIAIGKTYQGGIIFYIDRTGKHGLIAAPRDQGPITGTPWHPFRFRDGGEVTGASAITMGSGLANTNKIVKALGSGDYAAKRAANLVLGGYDDWFLPSLDELILMYKNIGPGAAAPLTNIGDFALDGYWSSSEQLHYEYDAWDVDFAVPLEPNGYTFEPKYYSRRVRAVRAF